MFQHSSRICLALWLIGVFSTAQAQTSPDGAAEFLRKVGDETIVLLKDRSRPKLEKEAELRKILNKSIDMKTIGRFALGKTWREINDKQKARYLKLFQDYGQL